jgi:cyclopropane fatty-acyl-phospholipid synthase-like methyltransferase
MSSFGQAEEQVLVTILELTDREQTADDASMAAFAPGFFRRSLVDWGQAAARLSAQGLIVQTDGVYTLTASGRAQAERWRKLRPSIWYFYVDFYAAASTSQASAAFCERVYGRNMSQHGYMTMTQLDRLIAVANLGPENRVLDLGCGNGMIAEYISDQTGAHVHGLDYMEAAIRLAQERTRAKRDRLTFAVADMNTMELAPALFDTVIAVDSLYFGDTEDLITRLTGALQPGGQIVSYFMQILWEESDDRRRVEPEGTDLGQALTQLGLAFETWDITAEELTRARVARRAAEDLRADYEAEGNAFLYKNRIDEANGNIEFIESGRCRRYLYRVRV